VPSQIQWLWKVLSYLSVQCLFCWVHIHSCTGKFCREVNTVYTFEWHLVFFYSYLYLIVKLIFSWLEYGLHIVSICLLLLCLRAKRGLASFHVLVLWQKVGFTELITHTYNCFSVILVKRLVTWYYRRKLTHNQEKLHDMREEKKKLLENVMDTETYKVAKEILEKFAPDQLSKSSVSWNQIILWFSTNPHR